MAEARSDIQFGTNRPDSLSSIEDIVNLPDMKTAFQMMKTLDIDRRGIKTKDEAVKRLVKYWKEREEEKPHDELDFSEIMKFSQDVSPIMTEKCEKVQRFYQKLPKNHQADLNNVFPGIFETFNKIKRKLKSAECPILFTGETTSGKSSLINLLLGTELLPTGALATTRTICEIKASKQDEKFAIFHPKSEQNGKRRAPKIYDLTDPEKFAGFQQVITEYDNETKESRYEKVEILWPNRFKESGLVMIDTPGIGENRNVLHLLEQYASRVYGFVYVINSSSAGGVLKRVRQFLKTMASVCDQEFSSDAAIFVFNKWDTVPESDRSDITTTTLAQLRNMFPEIQNDQIYYTSAIESMQVVNHGGEPEDRIALTNGLTDFIPSCLRYGFNINYRFLSQVIKRSIYSLKLAKQIDSKGLEEKRLMQDQLLNQISCLESSANRAIANLRLQLKNEAELLQNRVEIFLQSPCLKLDQWDPIDCPNTGPWREVASKATDHIKQKLQSHIDKWEKSENIGKSIKEKIRDQIKQDFEFMEDRMKELGGALLGGDVHAVNNFHTSVKRPTKSVKQLFSSASRKRPAFDRKSLGSVICLAGSLDLSSKQTKGLFKSYKSENRGRVMQEASKRFIESIKIRNLENYIQLFLAQIESSINDMEKRIPHILHADRKLFDNLNCDLSISQKNLESLYPLVLTECLEIQGGLDMLYVEKLRKEKPYFRYITWNINEIIGCGSFADVYYSKIRNNENENVDVAVKVYKNPINVKNVSDILLEARTLKDLSHVNIVKYYGSTLREYQRSGKPILIWALIMEYCSKTLYDTVINQEFPNPGRCDSCEQSRNASAKTIFNFALQISEGLQHLHSKSLVHRDLKLANILISNDDVVKLADVGMAKAEVDITVSAVGSPIYMAPEVMQQNVIYDRKADIYSFSILAWEMWYGHDAATYMKTLMRSSVEASVLKDGLRPPLSIHTPPPDELANKLKECWNSDPEMRPEAKTLVAFFESFEFHVQPES